MLLDEAWTSGRIRLVPALGYGVLMAANMFGPNAEPAAEKLEAMLMQRFPPFKSRLELDLQVALAPALLATSGYSAEATGQAYARAAEFALALGQQANLLQALFGEPLFRLVSG